VDLYIVRHARPERQVVDHGDGADPALSELGLAQAERIADYLEQEQIDHVVSSTMLRAFQTAEPLARRLGKDIEQIDDLKESDHRASAYVPMEELSPDDPHSAHYFSGDLYETVFSDGFENFETRVVGAFEQVIAANRSRRVAVFCHGMVTATFLRSVLGFDDVFAVTVDYCGLSRVRASSSGVRSVRSVNETHHVRDLIEW
jgi:probable phosphoglycerate mutase